MAPGSENTVNIRGAPHLLDVSSRLKWEVIFFFFRYESCEPFTYRPSTHIKQVATTPILYKGHLFGCCVHAYWYSHEEDQNESGRQRYRMYRYLPDGHYVQSFSSFSHHTQTRIQTHLPHGKVLLGTSLRSLPLPVCSHTPQNGGHVERV